MKKIGIFLLALSFVCATYADSSKIVKCTQGSLSSVCATYADSSKTVKCTQGSCSCNSWNYEYEHTYGTGSKDFSPNLFVCTNRFQITSYTYWTAANCSSKNPIVIKKVNDHKIILHVLKCTVGESKIILPGKEKIQIGGHYNKPEKFDLFCKGKWGSKLNDDETVTYTCN